MNEEETKSCANSERNTKSSEFEEEKLTIVQEDELKEELKERKDDGKRVRLDNEQNLKKKKAKTLVASVGNEVFSKNNIVQVKFVISGINNSDLSLDECSSSSSSVSATTVSKTSKTSNVTPTVNREISSTRVLPVRSSRSCNQKTRQEIGDVSCALTVSNKIGGDRGRGRRRRNNNEKKSSVTVVNTNIGDDGNLFFCHFCREAGEVVCCDGCPNVFYLAFLPEGPSKKSLNSDDDP